MTEVTPKHGDAANRAIEEAKEKSEESFNISSNESGSVCTREHTLFEEAIFERENRTLKCRNWFSNLNAKYICPFLIYKFDERKKKFIDDFHNNLANDCKAWEKNYIKQSTIIEKSKSQVFS